MSMEEELTSLGKEISEAKTEWAQYEGRKAEITERLKKEHNISGLEDGATLLASLKADLEKQRATIEADFLKLKKTYEW